MKNPDLKVVNAIQAEIDNDEEIEQNHQNEVNNKVAELEKQYRDRGLNER